MERLKRLFLGGGTGRNSPPETSASGARDAAAAPGSAPPQAAAQGAGSSHERHSHALEQFSGSLQESEGLHVLDLGGATQANVAFVTGLGHKLYSEVFLRVLESSFPQAGGDAEEDQPAAAEVRAFVDLTLDFPEAHFDGVLLWDVLEFLPRPLLGDTIERLHKIMKPGAYLLALFHADEKQSPVPVYSYRILTAKTLQVAQRESRRPVQLFNNRAVEKVFQPFHSVKFFLARDNLREVIVRR
jgi:hypothetical protein